VRKYETYFSTLRHVEEHYLTSRLGTRAWLVAPVPVPIRRFVVSKLAGHVFVCTKVNAHG
jgi:hypothetical protein